jgi:hypothetical protein
MSEFGFVAEDIEWFRDDWWSRRTELLSDGHIRRASFSLGALLVDGLIQRAWHRHGFTGEPEIAGPDLQALAARDGLRLDLSNALVAGGGRENGAEIAFLGAFRVDNPDTGIPASAHEGFGVQQTMIVREEGLLRKPSSLDSDVEHLWPLSAYLDAPAIVRRGLLITRRQFIEFFRAHPGGVSRVAPDDGRPVPQSADRGISELLGRVHAGLRDGIYFELLSVGQSIGRSSDLQKLATAIRAEERAQDRIQPFVKQYDSPSGNGTLKRKLFLGMPQPPGAIDPDAQFIEHVVGLKSLDTPIYRTIRWKYVRALFEQGSMPLMAPSLWDDPFERLVGETSVYLASETDNQPRLLNTLRRVVYGQCWSLNHESDAIWRIHSTVTKDHRTMRNNAIEEEGVRVRTTVRRLLRAVWDASPAEVRRGLFFGRVRYMHERDALEAIAAELLESDPETDSVDARARRTAESLLMEREPFAHEDECRLIYVDAVENAEQQALFGVSIAEPNTLFRHVALDPRLNAIDVRDRQKELRKFGFTGQIIQSELYRPVRIDLRREELRGVDTSKIG